MSNKIEKHGISIGIERINQHFFLMLKVVGKLTHQDYEIITPMLDSALANVKDPKVNAFIDATELEGWEARAAWDDLKLGLKHGNEFEKIAIFGHQKWQVVMAKIGGWFIAGEVRYFDGKQQAIDWLAN